MDKNNTLIPAKQAIISVEEAAITKENVEKTINAVKDIVKNVKSRAVKVARGATTAAKKTVTNKIDVVFYVQYQGKEVSNKSIKEKVYAEWLKSHKISDIKSLDIYLKVEEDTAYCLVNGDNNIDLKLF